MHCASEHHHLPVNVCVCEFLLQGVHHRLRRNGISRAVDRKDPPLDVATRPSNDRIRIGHVKHDNSFEVRASARLLQDEAPASAISYCGFLVSIDDPELIRLRLAERCTLDRRTQW